MNLTKIAQLLRELANEIDPEPDKHWIGNPCPGVPALLMPGSPPVEAPEPPHETNGPPLWEKQPTPNPAEDYKERAKGNGPRGQRDDEPPAPEPEAPKIKIKDLVTAYSKLLLGPREAEAKAMLFKNFGVKVVSKVPPSDYQKLKEMLDAF